MAEWGDYHYSDKTEADEWENPNASGYYSPYHHPQYDYHYPGYGGSSPYCDSRHRTCFVGIPRTDASRPVDIEVSHSQHTCVYCRIPLINMICSLLVPFFVVVRPKWCIIVYAFLSLGVITHKCASFRMGCNLI